MTHRLLPWWAEALVIVLLVIVGYVAINGIAIALARLAAWL